MIRFAVRISFALLCCCVFCQTALYAQREQIGLRFEAFGNTTPKSTTPSLFNNATFGAAITNLNVGFRSILGEDGGTMLINGFQYRYVNAFFPVASSIVGKPGTEFQMASLDAHLLMYDFMFFRTLSDQFQLVAVARPGIFSDFRNININHFRLEATAFLDWFASDNLTLGLGFAYNASNFGRLINVPVLHMIWIPTPEVMVDMLLPQRLDIWYYPNKQWDIGWNLSLLGSQFQLGAPNQVLQQALRSTNPAAADIAQFHFANATTGPVIRHNFYDKMYLSLEGGYTIIRRFDFADANKEALVSYNPGSILGTLFNANNTFFFRIGLQVFY